jgi:cysteine desulfurase
VIGAAPRDVIFTSGGTESDNLAIRGAAEAAEPSGRRHLVASTIEHEAVLNTVKHLARRGWSATWLAAGPDGIVTEDALAASLRDDTALVSVMLANNEIGTVEPIAALARAARARGALFHTDAVQGVGKVPVDVVSLEVDLLSLSAHKFNGPQGAGALWVRPGTHLSASQTGGRQERNRRAGTENVAGIVGLGAACALAGGDLDEEASRQRQLRDALWTGLREAIPGVVRNGHATECLPNTLNVAFPGARGSAVLAAAPALAASTGSACHEGSETPSAVLTAMGLDAQTALGAVRLSLGRGTTREDVAVAAGALVRAHAAILAGPGAASVLTEA